MVVFRIGRLAVPWQEVFCSRQAEIAVEQVGGRAAVAYIETFGAGICVFE